MKLDFLIARARLQQAKHRGATFLDVANFFQQMSTLISAGVLLSSALHICAEQSESAKLARVIRAISDKISSGNSFFRAISEYPNLFAIEWRFMIRTGEVSGKLRDTLTRLSQTIKEAQASRGKIVSALIYPSILLFVAIASMAIMIFKVIPTFQEFFVDLGGELPPITRFVLAVSHFATTKGPYAAVVMAGAGFALWTYSKTDTGGRVVRAVLATVPLAGDLYIQMAMEKFAYTMSLLLESGVPLLEAIKTTQEVFKENRLYYDALGSAHASLARGNTLAVSLGNTRLFTTMTLNLVKVGEESGTLAKVLHELAIYYGARAELLVTRLTGLLEPAIVIFMGGVMGTMLASLYIPMFQMSAGGGTH